jgi:hypothetical protein
MNPAESQRLISGARRPACELELKGSQFVTT